MRDEIDTQNLIPLKLHRSFPHRFFSLKPRSKNRPAHLLVLDSSPEPYGTRLIARGGVCRSPAGSRSARRLGNENLFIIRVGDQARLSDVHLGEKCSTNLSWVSRSSMSESEGGRTIAPVRYWTGNSPLSSGEEGLPPLLPELRRQGGLNRARGGMTGASASTRTK